MYLTINTVFDTEFDDLKEFIIQSAIIGVDAFIIQDLGVLIYKKLYKYPLTASTHIIHSPMVPYLLKKWAFLV